MNRRGFLKALGLVPALPLVAKAVEAQPVNASPSTITLPKAEHPRVVVTVTDPGEAGSSTEFTSDNPGWMRRPPGNWDREIARHIEASARAGFARSYSGRTVYRLSARDPVPLGAFVTLDRDGMAVKAGPDDAVIGFVDRTTFRREGDVCRWFLDVVEAPNRPIFGPPDAP